MTPPPRPAPITAAAVLLLVFGGECLLLAGAILILEATAAIPGLPAVSGCGMAALAAGIGGLFLRAGVNVLSATFQAAGRAHEFVTVIAVVTTVCAASATWVVVIVLRGAGSQPALKLLILLSGTTTLWANAVGLFTAAWLLRRHAGRYQIWVASVRRPPDDLEETP